MCGIVGYVGKSDACPFLMNALAKLEYRGYDSAGIAVINQHKSIEIIKAKGQLANLEALIANQMPSGKIGIGHTRWATHGEPNIQNAHPQYNESRTIAVVHNGIIENYSELKRKLSALGYRFASQTDTEVMVHLLDHYHKSEKDVKKVIKHALSHIKGSYAFGILFADHPETIFATRKDSPLVIGISHNGNFIASDAPAILAHTQDLIFIEQNNIALITPNRAVMYNEALEEIQTPPTHITWDAESSEKGGFAHFMLKEIHEQQTAIQNTLSPHIVKGNILLPELRLSNDAIKALDKIHIIACGSAYHAGAIAKSVIEKLARIPVEVDLASEFRYRDPIITPNTLCLAISQSGETADTLAALREAKARAVPTLAIVNVTDSSIAREADSVLYTRAGQEVAVATTKAYGAQLALLDLLALHLAEKRGSLSSQKLSLYLKELESLPDKIAALLSQQDKIRNFAKQNAAKQGVFFIGRGLDYAVALEGSLKLKEVSYIFSQAYAAGELKHGSISLVENGTLVVALATQPELYEKMSAAAAEVVCRGASLFSITFAGNKPLLEMSEYALTLPGIDPLFAPSLAALPLQLFAYYVSITKGLDVDKPRNLAKSVTVE